MKNLQIFSFSDKSSTRAFALIDHIDPYLCVWSGGEISSNLFQKLSKGSKRVIIVDTFERRLQDPVRGLFKVLSVDYSCVARVLTGSQNSLEQWVKLGVPLSKIELIGFMEHGRLLSDMARPQPIDVAGRPLWYAANLAYDEVVPILVSHRKAMRRAHRLLLVVTPQTELVRRALVSNLAKMKLRAADFHEEGRIFSDDIHVLVTSPEFDRGGWYQTASIVYMGGSLSAIGAAEDPFEVIEAGAALIYGARSDSCEAIYNRLTRSHAGIEVKNAVELGDAVVQLLASDKCAEQVVNAWQAVSSGSNVAQRLYDLTNLILDGELDFATDDPFLLE